MESVRDVLDLQPWMSQVDRLAPIYQNGQPFPHIHLENFLDLDTARELEAEFPKLGSPEWIHLKHYNENKLTLGQRGKLPEKLGRLVDELNSEAFTVWLSRLTGIPGLVPDPSLEGGGLHQSQRGGFLNVHADFTVHYHHPEWQRRINLILYLNDGWQEDWKGALELWDRQMTQCVIKVPPVLNHAVIFSTDEDSYHGFPEPLLCPDGISRKSVALYYYTATSTGTPRSTNYRARPQDAAGKAALIWIDKQLLALYSRIKSKLGLSDQFASRVLAFLSRSKEKH